VLALWEQRQGGGRGGVEGKLRGLIHFNRVKGGGVQRGKGEVLKIQLLGGTGNEFEILAVIKRNKVVKTRRSC